MRVIVYDHTPNHEKGASNKEATGTRIGHWFLWLSWAVWARVLVLFGRFDACKGVSHWTEAQQWLLSQEYVEELQIWCHGSEGNIWFGEEFVTGLDISRIAKVMRPGSLLWLRACSTFGTHRGQVFAGNLAYSLGCKVAGHTRTIGLRQSGLHSLLPGQAAYWSVAEGVGADDADPPFYTNGDHSVSCFASNIPKGW